MGEIHSLTLDTDVIRDVWDDDDRRVPVERLIELADSGRVSLSVTRHIHQDIPRSPLAERINELPELSINRSAGVFQLDVSVLDGHDRLGSGRFEMWWNRRESRRSTSDPKLPGKNDSLHLHAHYLSGRDAFVTWDKAILRLREDLSSALGIVVLTPAEAVELIV